MTDAPPYKLSEDEQDADKAYAAIHELFRRASERRDGSIAIMALDIMSKIDVLRQYLYQDPSKSTECENPWSKCTL